MRPVIKWIAVGLAAIVVLAGLLIAFVAATFDPNDYKDRIVAAVQEKTGRTLALEGDLSLSFYPSIGIELGRASLSERKGGGQFAAVDSAVVAVKLLPLLSKDVIVDGVELKGLRLNLERDASGRMNFEDLMPAPADPSAGGPAEPSSGAPVTIDIARVEIADADITFVDRTQGAHYRLSNLDLETGRIAPGVATPVELSGRFASEKDKAQIDTRLETTLTFDPARAHYKLEQVALSAKGDYGDIRALDAAIRGSIEARTQSGEYLANAVSATVTGQRPAGAFEAKLDAPRLTLTRDKVEGDKLALDATSTDARGKLVARVTIGSVAGAFEAVKAAPLDATIQMQGGGRDYRAQLNGTLTANLERNTGAIDFSGQIDESKVRGQAAITRASPLALTFDLDADRLDVDRLMGRAPAAQAPATQATGQAKPAADQTAGTAAQGAQAPAPRQPAGSDADGDRIDLSALEGIDVSGKIRVGALTLLDLHSSQVQAAVKVAGGRLEVAPISAQLYDGRLEGSLSAQAAANPVFAVRQTLTGVALGPLLRDAAQIDTLEGKGTVRADLRATGATVEALKKALNGTASVQLADGAVKGVDIAGTIRSVRTRLAELRGKTVQSSNKNEKTDFSELTATFKVTNGVARNDDLSMKSPLLRVQGAGDIDIGANRLDYALKATLVGTTKGQGGRDVAELAGITVPVQLTGTLDSPQWSIDFAGLAAGLAEKKLKDEVLKRIPGAAGQPEGKPAIEDAIKDRLKGLFGR